MIFKTCSCCGKDYETETQFKAECDFVGAWSEFGLDLWNCKCKGTLSIEQSLGSKALAIKERKARLSIGLNNKGGPSET